MDEKEIFNREKSFRYNGDRDLKISKIPTSATVENLNKDDIKARIESNIQTLQDLQGKLYAQNHLGVLVIFQEMDG